MKFAREAWPFVVPFIALAIILGFSGYRVWASVAAVLAILLLLFFRHPSRTFSGDPNSIIAAADGVVLKIDTLEDAEVGPGKFHRVITFLSVFDVHTQRAPTQGEVIYSKLTDGRKVAAFNADAGEVNARHLSVLKLPNGDLIGVRQIVGLVARRIVCYLKPGQEVQQGETIGLIKFGSRVDLLVPATYRIQVGKGDRMRSGETLVASPPEGKP
ncbi:MAG: phosphatidylserine decarboxylase [Deltaproteobacteria bacterium]|nr:phosphatidylserine decarboxylase [Deltaproteobacteria bacterium]